MSDYQNSYNKKLVVRILFLLIPCIIAIAVLLSLSSIFIQNQSSNNIYDLVRKRQLNELSNQKNALLSIVETSQDYIALSVFETGKKICALISFLTKNAINSSDAGNLKKYDDILADLKIVVDVKYFDRAQKTIYSKSFFKEKDVTVVTTPVYLKSVNIGSIELGISKKQYLNQKESLDNEVIELYGMQENALINMLKDIKLNIAKSRNFSISISLIITVIILFVLAVAIYIIISKNIIKTIHHLGNSMKDIALGNGELTKRLHIMSRDEIGKLVYYFNSFVDKLQRIILVIKVSSDKLREVGETLSTVINETSTSEVQIASNINATKSQVEKQFISIQQVAQAIKGITKSIEELNQDLIVQSANITESSASIEEMTTNIKSIYNSLENSNAIFANLKNSAEKGRIIVDKIHESIQKIETYSENLTEINQMINGISSQTNVLAMNASIEAAHAGSVVGRGFAVVANEIRNLAEQSNSKSKEINSILTVLANEIMNVVPQSEKLSDSFIKISDNLKNAFNIESMIKNAITEQFQGSEQILKAISELSEITGKITHASTTMNENGRIITKEIDNLVNFSKEIEGSINEISIGTKEISSTMINITDISVDNKNHILKIDDELKNFKV